MITTIALKCHKCQVGFERSLAQVNKDKSKNVFCSHSCSAAFNNIGKTKHSAKERTCKNCNKIFFKKGKHRSYSFCQVCLSSFPTRKEFNEAYYASLTLAEYRGKLSVKGKHPSWKHSHIREFNRYWNSGLRKMPCRNCGYSKHVELAHIRPVSSFPDTATLGEVNAENNVLPLCRNCHWELDNGLLIPNKLASPEEFESPVTEVEARSFIQLSYGDK